MSKKYCPRARYNGKTTARFMVAKDPAVRAVAHMVVAGIDRKYSLHPRYKSYLKEYGKENAQELIRAAVEIPGACDIIQTDMCLGGIGLFGGLSEDEKEFIFYEWTSPSPMLRIHITHQEARDVVSGKQKFVKFVPCTKEHFADRERDKEKLYLQEKLRLQ